MWITSESRLSPSKISPSVRPAVIEDKLALPWTLHIIIACALDTDTALMTGVYDLLVTERRLQSDQDIDAGIVTKYGGTLGQTKIG